MRTLAEAIVSALPATEFIIMAYGKILKVQIHEEKKLSGKKISISLWETNEFLNRKEKSAGLRALLAEGIVDFEIM